MHEFLQEFIAAIKQTGWLEAVAVVMGIASVWFAKTENILVYPVGLVNTVLYIYLSIKGDLYGEASVNLYYTIMSIYGWILWARHNEQQQPALNITNSSAREWGQHLLFFSAFYMAIY